VTSPQDFRRPLDAAVGPDLPACLAGSSSPTRAPHFCPA